MSAGDAPFSRRREVRVRVPASSANLGPGFDVLAVALSLHLEVRVRETGAFSVLTELDLPCDRRNLVVRGFERLAPADRFSFEIASEIPLSGGLGSSAAAALAGLIAADRLYELGADVRAEAVALEGHPDNVAASIEGGFVICDGSATYRIEPPPSLAGVLLVPARTVRTARARGALPPLVALADAVFNVACAATLTLGLARGDLELVAAGLRDRLHQPHRAHLFPRSMELAQRARELGALGATISGAG
ncbi:MAG: homoserine kinase, partial [Solirubrobacteraceae bacterium]